MGVAAQAAVPHARAVPSFKEEGFLFSCPSLSLAEERMGEEVR
jgi:hypothetical protein